MNSKNFQKKNKSIYDFQFIYSLFICHLFYIFLVEYYIKKINKKFYLFIFKLDIIANFIFNFNICKPFLVDEFKEFPEEK